MSNSTPEDPKPDGAAFDDFFESLGKKAENLTINDKQNEKEESPVATNGTKTEEPEEDQRVVDEIESLCMNCRENVGSLSGLRLLNL